MKRVLIFTSILASVFCFGLSAHDNGFVLNLRANFGGTQTMPSIGQDDLDKMGASYMEGMMGFVIDGEAELGYIFGSENFFGMDNNDTFGGMGVFVTLGVGQGYAGQISGSLIPAGEVTNEIDVFFNAFYTPVASFSLVTKVYLFKNRMAVGLGVGGKLIADMTPTYEFYASDVIPAEVGTLIVTEDMIKNMNPLMLTFKGSVEYYQPVVERVELILAGYAVYNLYAPGYITMPATLADLAKFNNGFDSATTPLNSFKLNSLDFGITLGLSFKA